MEPSINLKVRDVMTRGVITVPMHASAIDVARLLADEHIHGVVVTAPGGDIMGIVSEADILRVFNRDLNKITAEDIMSEHAKIINPTSSIQEAANRMESERIHRLVVTSPGCMGKHMIPVGILCASDIMKKIASQ